MKKLLTSALVMALSFGAVQAQVDTAGHKGGKHADKARKEMGYQKLNLSADQQARVKTINDNYRNQMKSLKDQSSLSEADRKAKRESLHRQRKAELDAVLTPQQRTQAATAKKEWKGKGHDGMKEDRKNSGKARDMNKSRGKANMTKELNLSTEQQARMEALRTENKTRLAAIRSDASLTQEQKKAKAGEIMKAQKEQMKSILTPEQQQKMKQGRKGRPAQTRK